MMRKGFTLIEILIVVAIIAILASVVLVGLGPTQQAGRDARRLSDLQEVQNGLGLFYNDCGFYPGGVAAASGPCSSAGGYILPTAGTWSSLQASIASVVANAGPLPSDPSSNRSYTYFFLANGATTYAVGAALENTANSVFNGYNPPIPAANIGNYTAIYQTGAAIYPADCSTNPNYCVGI